MSQSDRAKRCKAICNEKRTAMSCKQRDTALLARKLAHPCWLAPKDNHQHRCKTVRAHACTESTIDHLSLPALIHLTPGRYSRISARRM
jgi:hypothetical protein